MSEILDCCNPNLLTISTKDMYQLENCLLFCTVTATEPGLIKTLDELLDEGKIKNDKSCRLLVISGGHGSPDDDQKKLTTAGGISCFTQMDMIVFRFYSSMCIEFGVAAMPDPCDYAPDSEKVIKIREDDLQPKPEGQTPSNEKYKMTLNLVNIANFHNKADKLITYLE